MFIKLSGGVQCTQNKIPGLAIPPLALAALGFLLFLDHTKLFPASGPLHVPRPLPSSSCPRSAEAQLPSFKSQTTRHLLREATMSIPPPPPRKAASFCRLSYLSIPSLCFLFFIMLTDQCLIYPRLFSASREGLSQSLGSLPAASAVPGPR